MSRVARIGQVTVVVMVAAGVGFHTGWRDTHPGLAWAALAAWAWLPAAVMAAGSLLTARVVARRSPADAAWLQEWLVAWWREWRSYLAVFMWRQPFRHRARREPALSDVPVVVLVHGYLCNRGFWLPWMDAVQQQGWTWRSVNLEPVFGSIDEMVSVLDPVMKQALAEGRPVVIVAHSMGGLVTRAWLTRQPTWPDALRGCVTIGSPHHGTWVARWANSLAGQQMREHSNWLTSLRAAERAEDAQRFLCWRSLTDHVVFPPANAVLAGADNRTVRSAGHVDLAFQPRVMTESLAWIASAFRSPAERTRS